MSIGPLAVITAILQENVWHLQIREKNTFYYKKSVIIQNDRSLTLIFWIGLVIGLCQISTNKSRHRPGTTDYDKRKLRSDILHNSVQASFLSGG